MKLNKILLILATCLPVISCSSVDNTTPVASQARDHSILDFHFDEEGKDIYDATNTKSYAINSVYFTSTNLKNNSIDLHKDGAVGKSILFDGYSTYFEVPSADVKSNDDYLSISCYIAPRAYDWTDRNDTNTTTDIVSKIYYDDSFSAGYSLGYQRDGYVVFKIGTGDELLTLRTDSPVLDKGKWNYVTATFNGVDGLMYIYLNGQEVSCKSFKANTKIEQTDNSLYIGRNPLNTNSDTGSIQGVVSGLMDEVTIYDVSLTSKQIMNSYLKDTPTGFASIPYEDIGLQTYLKDDKDKPLYHGGPNEHWMNEPHAPIYYKGIYHLFFQHQVNGPYFNGAKGISWGHLVSSDMVNWTQIQDALTPTLGTVAPDGIWSGGSSYATVKGEENVPVLLFTAGDYVHEGMVSNQNIGLATPKDPSDPYLTEWEMSDTLAVEQKSGEGVSGEFRDASLFIEDNTYYMLVGSSNNGKGTALLYTAPVTSNLSSLHNFTYRGHVFDYPEQDSQLGSVWELPILQRLTDKDGNPTDKYIFIISPAPATTADNNVYYWIGTFNKDTYKFVPDNYGYPLRMDFGPNVFTGPSAFKDPISGLVTVMSISQDKRKGDEAYPQTGWANNVGLTRQVYFENGKLKITPVNTIETRGDLKIDESDLTLFQANEKLASIDSDTIRIKVTFDGITSGQFGINARATTDKDEYTSFYGDSSFAVYSDNRNNRRNASTNNLIVNGQIDLSDSMTIDLFVDRSCLEAFYNYEKTISMRSYPESDEATHVSLFAESSSINIKELKVYEMGGLGK